MTTNNVRMAIASAQKREQFTVFGLIEWLHDLVSQYYIKGLLTRA